MEQIAKICKTHVTSHLKSLNWYVFFGAMLYVLLIQLFA